MRSPGVLCVAALLLACIAAGAAEAGRRASPQLTFALPQPGHVALAEVRLRLPDVRGKRLRLRVPLSLPGPLPNGAKALGAVLARRASGANVYTILLAVVNPQGPADAASGGSGLPVPLDGGFVAAAASALSFPVARPAPPAQPLEIALAPPRAAGFATTSKAASYVDPVSKTRSDASALEIVGVDQGTDAQRAAAARALGLLGAPLDVLAEPNAQHALYDAGHPLGWKAASPATKRASRDAWSLLTAAPQGLSAAVAKLDAELGIAAAPAAPPPSAADRLYRFSIGPFQFSFDTPPHGSPAQPTHVTYSVPGASACGADPATAAWTLPYTVNAGAAASGSVTVNFGQENPFRIYLFFDYLPPGSVAAPLATLSAALAPVAGATPQMKVIIAAAGAVANVSGPTPELLPILALPTAAC